MVYFARTNSYFRQEKVTALEFQPRVECLYWVCGAGSTPQRACAASAGVSAGLTVVDVGASGRWDRFACSPPFHTPSSCLLVARVHACEELLCSYYKWDYPQVGATINSERQSAGEISSITWSKKIRRGWRRDSIGSFILFLFLSLFLLLSLSLSLSRGTTSRALDDIAIASVAGEPPAFLSSPLRLTEISRLDSTYGNSRRNLECVRRYLIKRR